MSEYPLAFSFTQGFVELLNLQHKEKVMLQSNWYNDSQSIAHQNSLDNIMF